MKIENFAIDRIDRITGMKLNALYNNNDSSSSSDDLHEMTIDIFDFPDGVEMDFDITNAKEMCKNNELYVMVDSLTIKLDNCKLKFSVKEMERL